MLVLSRKIGEEIIIGDNIRITVQRVQGNRVSLGVEAPADVRIVRSELQPIAASFDGGESWDRPGRPRRRPLRSAG